MNKAARDLNNKSHAQDPTHPDNPISNGTNGPGNTEANKLAQLESRLEDYLIFLDKLAGRVKDWEIATRRSVESLQQWGITFGIVLAPPSSGPHPPAYQAFTSLLYSLPGLCRTLEDDLQTTFHPLLRKLKVMAEHPKQLLNEMHALKLRRSPLARIWRPGTSGDHRRYLALRSTLLSQLPVLLDAMERAIELAVRMMTQSRVTFFRAVREKWIHLFNSLTEEGEHYGGTEETLRAWQVRWEEGQKMLLIWEKRYISAESALWLSLSVTSAGAPLVNGQELD